ncbi:unnamed protein product [Toxocara canis]|uniref:RRM domain-containing protein n=1 Tax=Toxocara canis TaxID=6265 RepID=A0A183UR40_TOXCA|nr:unnamed protein product [Toxocara canis]
MDEEELLLDSALPVDVKLGDLDEAAILDDEVPLEGEGTNTANVDGVEESEELDYDEEPDEDAERERAPRAGKFTSERVSARRNSAASGDMSLAGPSKTQTARDQPQPTLSAPTTKPPLASLHFCSSTIRIAPVSSIPARAVEAKSSSLISSSLPQPAPNVTAASVASSLPTMPAAATRAPPKVLINPHYKGPIRPRSELTVNWNTTVGVRSVTTVAVPPIRAPFVATQLLPAVHVPPPSLPFPAIASSSADFSHPPPAVVPIANFATPPPPVYGGTYASPAPAAVTSAGHWDQLVEGFLRRTTARRTSRSRSRSSSSSYSRSRYEHYSVLPRNHPKLSEVELVPIFIDLGPTLHVLGRRVRQVHRTPRSDPRAVSRASKQDVLLRDTMTLGFQVLFLMKKKRYIKEKTIECAKAIGLDSEYLSKLEEQKKMREEILRKKEERRVQNVQRASLTVTSQSKQSASGDTDGTNTQSSRRSEKTVKETLSEKLGGRERSIAEKRTTPRSPHAIRSRGSPGHMARLGRHDMPAKSSPLARVEVRRSSSRNKSPNAHRDSPFRTSTAIGGNRGQEQPQRVLVGSSSVRKREGDGASSLGKQASNGAVRKQPEKAIASRTGTKPTATQVQAKTHQSSGDRPASAKKKAYLAVVVKASDKTPPDMERMKLIAATVGPTKKVWKSHNDCVSLIFESHENAKKFMLQYNGFVVFKKFFKIYGFICIFNIFISLRKVINGVRLLVMLEKVFVNLAEL